MKGIKNSRKNSSTRPPRMYENKRARVELRGFSLLEVMVALAILALSITSLILVQARATRLAFEARNISIATLLARYQLMECKMEAQKKVASVGDFKTEGNFEDLGHPGFTWECHAPKFNMKPPSASDVEKNLKDAAPENIKKDVGGGASASSPFISMITDSLSDSVRELVVIIRWSDGNVDDELRVTTHVIDLTAMSGLSRMLAQGLKSFQSASDKKKDDNPPAGVLGAPPSEQPPKPNPSGPPPPAAPPPPPPRGNR